MLCANAPLLSVQIQLHCQASPRLDPLADSLKNRQQLGCKRASIKVKNRQGWPPASRGLLQAFWFGLS
jgi:hypothetical protein